jgi:hypothetical protein
MFTQMLPEYSLQMAAWAYRACCNSLEGAAVGMITCFERSHAYQGNRVDRRGHLL